MDENKDNGKAEIYSQRVRAGKRTYFFDVKATRSNDYYLTITESKRRYKEDGYFYEKHKIFLYKEDFKKFVDALSETVEHVKNELMPEVDFSQFDERETKKEVQVENDSGLDQELSWE
ncbi:MAG: PUR family DNA/RNA-binding protein [Cyclobacteriaceae bacterium]|nr:PUR family DNA/RNA-binding protein [Cyclobacteriaceae bacterium]